MAFPEDFARECLYDPAHWYVHDVLSIDRELGRVVAQVDTTRLGALVDAQNPWKGHLKHVPGAVMIQITGTLGNLHAVYVMDLRPTEGWVGYGTHVRSARFPSFGRIGPPMQVELLTTRTRRLRGRHFADYKFTYTQEERVVYESEQAAVWVRGDIVEAGL